MPTKKPTSQPQGLTRICARCQHRLLTVILDTGERKELDTQRHTWIITGREAEGLPVYIGSRSYVEHADVCTEGGGTDDAHTSIYLEKHRQTEREP